jgi:hypothetical protein
MPVHSHIDWDDGLILFTVRGPLGQADLEAALSSVYEDSERSLPSTYLWDLRGAEIDWSGEQVKKFVYWVIAHRPEGTSRNAVVVSSDLQFGLARMYEALISEIPANLSVFRDMDAAREWVTGSSVP